MQDSEKADLIMLPKFKVIDMNIRPKLMESHEIYKDSHIRVIQDVLAVDSSTWNQVYLEWNNKNTVCVIPFEKDGAYLIRQYRHASKKYFWQFPGGIMEVNVSQKNIARKELLEETGFVANKIVKIGTYSPEPGLTSAKINVYLATNLTKKTRRLEKSEIGMKLKFFSLGDLEKKINKGEISCGITLSSYLFLKIYLRRAF